MTGLLDTHTLIWALRFPQQLSSVARNFIDSPQNDIVVSPASAYEISAKVGLGKAPELESLALGLAEAVADGGYTFLAIDEKIALRAGRLSFQHRDPFDRLLAATALENDIILLSKDAQVDVFGVRRIW